MKIAVVIPRYGEGALGGAEAHGAAYARRLSGIGHEVELVTTCALDHSTWENVLPEEAFVEEPAHPSEGKITVRRFEVEPGDRDRFAAVEWRIVHRLHVTRDEEIDWIAAKGHSPRLVEFLRSADHDRVVFMPYLAATTYFGAVAVPDKAVVHTLFHDEPYARLSITAEIVAAARTILFNSPPEKRLARRLFGELPPHELGGMGFEPLPPGADPAKFRRTHGLSGNLVLYAGRWEGGKGVPRLVSYARKARRRGLGITLALIGGGPDGPRGRGGGVVPVGYVAEDEKYSAFAAADLFCQPSQNESLSIVLMEAWLAGSPALVNGECAVTRYHCRQSGGGLWFTSFPEFEAAVEEILSDRDRAERMALGGSRYVLETYGWESVLDRVERALEW